MELNRAVAVAMADERGLELVEAIDLPDYTCSTPRGPTCSGASSATTRPPPAYRTALALEMNAGAGAFLERRLAEVT